MNISKTIRILELPIATQRDIEIDVVNALVDYIGNVPTMIKEALESRLCDLEELIDINKYIV